MTDVIVIEEVNIERIEEIAEELKGVLRRRSTLGGFSADEMACAAHALFVRCVSVAFFDMEVEELDSTLDELLVELKSDIIRDLGGMGDGGTNE